MRKEIDKAVETFHRIAFGTRKPGNKVISDGKLASLVTVLTELLLARYKNNWYPSNPNRGSGYRCLRINGQCIDPTIVAGLKRAEIELSILPKTELTIWVDPGVVSVRIGEEGSIGSEVIDEEVFRLGLKGNPPIIQRNASTSDEDEAYSSRSPSPAGSEERPMSISPPPVNNSPPPHPPVSAAAEFNPYPTSRPPQYQQQFRMSPPRLMGKNMPPSNHPTPPRQINSSGHIPPRSSYSHPRALYYSQDNNNGSFQEGQYREGAINSNLKRQAIPMHVTGIMNGSFLDLPIPAMA